MLRLTPIRVQVRDEYNATAERNFIVNLQTIYHPEKKLSVALLNDSYLNSYNRDLLYPRQFILPISSQDYEAQSVEA